MMVWRVITVGVKRLVLQWPPSLLLSCSKDREEIEISILISTKARIIKILGKIKKEKKKKKNGKENKYSRNCLDCYFYKNNVLDASFTKRIVWTAKNVIFSAGSGVGRKPDWVT